MCFILATAISLVAQTRSITNADLEKYRQARLTAEREYRDNYEKLGMPSPEELARRREQSIIETEKLSAKLRDEQLERDRLDAQREQYNNSYNSYPPVIYEQPRYDPGYFWSWGLGYGRGLGNRGGIGGGIGNGGGVGNRRPFLRPTPYQQPGYVAGGQFWPTGSRTPSLPPGVNPRGRRRN